MQKPPLSPDESARLETLQSLKILDTAPDERFDRLTRIAKRLFRVPIALVSLVDENRQWFKSVIGLSVSETSRDISFCGHAILGDEIFIIPNTTKDERFADNPLVLADPHIRFYAGYPLKAPNGRKLGTLCILDQQPRDFTWEDVEAMKDLAAMVELEIAAIQLATLDELTSIANRRGFKMLAQHHLHLCARENIAASLVFMDLDKFKFINDSFGHLEGDLALVAFADQMISEYRDSDILARLGGDEFAALLTNTTKNDAKNILDERFCPALDKYNQKVDRGYAISFSYGIVEFDPAKHLTIETLMADADLLMYEQKRSKR